MGYETEKAVGRIVRFSAPDISAAKGGVTVVQGATGERVVAACEWATSDNLVDWTPHGVVMTPRRGYFDSSLTEVRPAAILTEKGIVVFYNGKNSNGGAADPKYPRGAYCAGQALFDAHDPAADTKLWPEGYPCADCPKNRARRD